MTESNPYQTPGEVEICPDSEGNSASEVRLIGSYFSLLWIGLASGLIDYFVFTWLSPVMGLWWTNPMPPLLIANWIFGYLILIALIRPLVGLIRKAVFSMAVAVSSLLLFVPICSGGVLISIGGMPVPSSIGGESLIYVCWAVTHAVIFPVFGYVFFRACQDQGWTG